jgi:hypothetical protein
MKETTMTHPLNVLNWSMTIDVDDNTFKICQSDFAGLSNSVFLTPEINPLSIVGKCLLAYSEGKLNVYCAIGLSYDSFINQIETISTIIHKNNPTLPVQWSTTTAHSTKTVLPIKIQQFLEKTSFATALPDLTQKSLPTKVPEAKLPVVNHAQSSASAPFAPRQATASSTVIPTYTSALLTARSKTMALIVENAIKRLENEVKPFFSFQLFGFSFTLHVPFHVRKIAKKDGLQNILNELNRDGSNKESIQKTINEQKKNSQFLSGFFSQRTSDLVVQLERYFQPS